MTTAHTRDFTKKRPPVWFTIDDERYDCYKALDVDQLRKFANLAVGLGKLKAEVSAAAESDETGDSNDAVVAVVSSAERALDQIAALMKIVMKKTSYAAFITKLQPSDEVREDDDFEPIDQEQLLDIVKWLMGIYTKRPSQPSSRSSTGSTIDDGGTSSTAGASDGESEPED